MEMDEGERVKENKMSDRKDGEIKEKRRKHRWTVKDEVNGGEVMKDNQEQEGWRCGGEEAG